MDLTTPKYYHPSSLFASSQVRLKEEKNKRNPFAEAINSDETDLICKLNLKETSEFVKSLPMSDFNLSTQKRRETFVGSNNIINSTLVRKVTDSPSTPGRPVFSFSVSRKSVPSKWDDAEKWVIGGNGGGVNSCQSSPAHHAFTNHNTHNNNNNNNNNNINHLNHIHNYVFGGNHVVKQSESSRSSISKPRLSDVIAEKSRGVIEEKQTLPHFINCNSNHVSLEDHLEQQHKHLQISSSIAFNGVIVPADLPLKDKYTDEIGPFTPNFRYSEPTKEAFLFKSQKLHNEPMKDAFTEMVPYQDVKHRDIGTEMTPLGSSTTSRCHTPFKSTSPARYNTPEGRSGPLALMDQRNSIDMTQLQECHLAKLQIGSNQFDSATTNWSTREEEEEDVSKSLRHFELGRRSLSVTESRACAWEEEEKTKSCLRYQREEAKIQAWINLQTAKAEAQSRKLEVKIQKMRSDLEEKIMKRMTIVNRRAEEWRATAQIEHSEQIRKATERAQKLILNHNRQHSHLSPHIVSCGCFPCTSDN